MTTVLVTGANGFVGRALLPLLKERGHGVRAAVRRDDTGVDGADSVVAVGDIGPETEWRHAVAGVDAVVHLAARVHVMRERPTQALDAFRRVNVEGTRRLAEAAAAAGARRFVYLSSVKALVDESRDDPLSPDVPPAPTSSYGISKLEAERALAEVAKRTGMEVVVLRPPLVYGPGVRGNFRTLLGVCALGLPLPLASVDNRRSLVFVGNLADAIEACIVHPEAAGRSFHLHDGLPLSTPDLIRCLGEALGRPQRLFRVPPGLMAGYASLIRRRGHWERVGGSLVVDDRDIRRTLGWAPPVNTAFGLRATAEWFNASRRR